ncbi:MAG: dihydrodipicolinate reductase C-terminal domain-containing protein [Collinsella sp.]
MRELGQNARVMHSGNYSIGIAALRHLVARPHASCPALTAKSSRRTTTKGRRPSGTAKLLLDAVVEAEPEEATTRLWPRGHVRHATPRRSVCTARGRHVAGVHEVSFFGQDEEVTLTHRATSRQIFVNGALAAAQKLVTREPGFYTFDQVMFA